MVENGTRRKKVEKYRTPELGPNWGSRERQGKVLLQQFLGPQLVVLVQLAPTAQENTFRFALSKDYYIRRKR